MASIEQKVYDLLSGASAVTSIVPAARIKANGVWQGIERPYIVHFAVDIDPTYTHDGMAALGRWPYQVTLYAANQDDLISLRAAVINALNASGNPRFFLTGAPPIDEPLNSDAPVLGVALLFDAWWESLS